MATFTAPTYNQTIGSTGLWRFVWFPVSKSVWIDSGDTVHESASPMEADLRAAKAGSGDFGLAVFRNGKTYTVTAGEETILTAAGYTVDS